MKTILLHTIRHTGTWRIAHLLEAAEKNSFITIPANLFHEAKGIPLDPSIEVRIAQDNKDIKRYLEENFTALIRHGDLDLVVFHTHYEETESGLTASVIGHKPTLPVVTPMRDPFLSLNSRIWRDFNTLEAYTSISVDDRLNYIKHHIDLFERILSAPKDHLFVFPIDLPGRQQRYEDMFAFCGLQRNATTDLMVKEWRQVNKTVDCYDPDHPTMYHEILRGAVKRYVGQPNDSNIFSQIKESLKDPQSTFAMTTLPLEWEYLQSKRGLIEKLKEHGYTGLRWWSE
jgi:hypothetical protein